MTNKRANHFAKKKLTSIIKYKINDFKQKALIKFGWSFSCGRALVPNKELRFPSPKFFKFSKIFQKNVRKANKHWHDLHLFVLDFAVWFVDPECVWRQGVWADIYQGVGTICIIYVIGVTCSSGCGSGVRHVTHLFLVPGGSTTTSASASSSERWTAPTSTTTSRSESRAALLSR